jgi:hypothetical protein
MCLLVLGARPLAELVQLKPYLSLISRSFPYQKEKERETIFMKLSSTPKSSLASMVADTQI